MSDPVISYLRCHMAAFISVLPVLLILLPGWTDSFGAELSVEVAGLDDGKLSVVLRLDGMFSGRALELIEKGFTAVLRYNVELWMVRRGWFDKFISGNRVAFRYEFDLLEGRYTVTELNDGPARIFEGLGRDAAISVATGGVRVELDIGDGLDPDGIYYVVAWAEREPLTPDDIESLRRWLVGLGRSGGSDSRFSRLLFRLAGDLFSYRNREVVSSCSDRFRLRELM